jgi:predicted histidine transporter YuiF (NhaC family)
MTSPLIIAIVIIIVVTSIAHVFIERFILASFVGSMISAYLVFEFASSLESANSTVSFIMVPAFFWSLIISGVTGGIAKILIRDFRMKQEKNKLQEKEKEEYNEDS